MGQQVQVYFNLTISVNTVEAIFFIVSIGAEFSAFTTKFKYGDWSWLPTPLL